MSGKLNADEWHILKAVFHSMTAPIASGRSDLARGLSPTGQAPPFHGAHPKRSFNVGLLKRYFRIVDIVINIR